MEHIEGTFKGARNLNIYYQGWLPVREAKAVLFIVHGLGEHSGRYRNVFNHFVPLGYAAYGFDLPGHGKSEGGREEVQSFEDYTSTLTTFYNMVKAWQAGKPIFLLGHSMGGLIAPYYLLDNQKKFNGAIISAPLIKVSENISPLTIAMGKVLSVVAPKAGLLTVNANDISCDPEVVKAYVNDPLVFHSKTPARLAAEMLKAMLRVNAELDKISLPFITVQGGDDKLVDPEGARILYNKASSKDKTLKIYEGFHHEVFNEPERQQVLKDVETWLAAHI